MSAYQHVILPSAGRRLLMLIVLALAALGLSGCASRGGSVPYDVADFSPPDVESVVQSPGQQRISPRDKLRITVFQVADLSGPYEVDGSGNIQFPLIGSVTAQGLTPDELSKLIASRLGQRYIKSPSVQVALVEQTEQTITVDGSVRQPGVMPIRGTTTLIRAVAMARGTSEDANPSRVLVMRQINGKRMAAAFDLQAIRRGQAEDPAIYGNDIVVVDGSRIRSAWRDVLSALPVLGIFTLF